MGGKQSVNSKRVVITCFIHAIDLHLEAPQTRGSQQTKIVSILDNTNYFYIDLGIMISRRLFLQQMLASCGREFKEKNPALIKRVEKKTLRFFLILNRFIVRHV